jgi:hypothetical protein
VSGAYRSGTPQAVRYLHVSGTARAVRYPAVCKNHGSVKSRTFFSTHRAACAAPLLWLDSPGGLRRSATVAGLTGRLAPLRYCCWTHRAACAAPLLLLDSPGGLRRSATVAGLTGRLAPLRYCCWTHRAACAAPLLWRAAWYWGRTRDSGFELLRKNNSTGDLLSFEGSCRQTYSFGTASTNEIFRRFAVSGVISECRITLPANHANEREWPCCELIVRLGDEASQAIGQCRADGLSIDRLRSAGARVMRSSYSRSLA